MLRFLIAHKPLLCLGLFTTLSLPTFSKDIADMSLSELLNVKVITSATKFDTSVNEAPASTTIITRKDIESFGYHTLADVLAAERSFYLAYDRNYTYVGSRGFARSGDYNRRVLILVDGFRVNDGYYEQGFVGTPFPVDMDLIEQIEIVRGANSASFGTNAVLAVINVVTKTAQPRDGGQVAVTAGNQNTQKVRLSWHGSDKNSDTPHNWSLSVSRYQTDGVNQLYFPEFDDPATNNGIYQDNDSDEVLQFFAQYTQNNLRISAYHSEREKAVPTASFGTLFNAPGGFTYDQKSQLNLEYTTEFDSGVASTTKAYIDRYYYTGDYIYDYPPLTINRDLADVSSASIEQLFSGYSDNHHWSVGFEYRDDWKYIGQNNDVQPYALYAQNKGSKSRAAIFVQDEYSPSQKWNFVFGARLDDYQLFGSTLNPKIAVVYNQSDKSRWKFLTGRSFRAPSIPEQSKAQRQQDPVDLTPEINHNLELVYEYASTEQSQFLFSLYQNKGTDTIIVGATSASGRGFINDDKTATARGFETEYLYRDGDGTQYSASYGYIKSSDLDEIVAADSPKHLLKLKWLKNISDDWRVGLNGQYMSKRRTASGAIVGSFFLAHLNINYYGLQHQGWRIRATINNLFDEEYADPPSTNFEQLTIEQDPRTFRITAEWQF